MIQSLFLYTLYLAFLYLCSLFNAYIHVGHHKPKPTFLFETNWTGHWIFSWLFIYNLIILYFLHRNTFIKVFLQCLNQQMAMLHFFWESLIKAIDLSENKCELSYFQSVLELLSHGTRLWGVPFATGSQVSQLGHKLLHLLTLTKHLLPVGAWQRIRQPAALCNHPTDGCLTYTHTNIMTSKKSVKLTNNIARHRT